MQLSSPLKVGIIIQARMGATRLPGKPLFKVLEKSLLEYQIERLKKVSHPLVLILATTSNPQDKVLIEVAKSANISYYTGSEADVLDRYVKSARHYNIDVIIRVTADCPLIDPKIIDAILGEFLSRYPQYDYYSNTLERTFPRGMDVEIFKRRALEEAYDKAFFEAEREHVTPFVYNHPELFKIGQFTYKENASKHRWTVDTQDDFELIKRLIEQLYPKKRDFDLEDLLHLIEKHPEWSLINAHVEQKKV